MLSASCIFPSFHRIREPRRDGEQNSRFGISFPPRYRLRNDRLYRVYLCRQGFIPLACWCQQVTSFADGHPDAGLHPHLSRECVERDRCPDTHPRSRFSVCILDVLPSNVVSRVVGQLTICELPIILWLLIRGAKDQPLSDEPAFEKSIRHRGEHSTLTARLLKKALCGIGPGEGDRKMDSPSTTEQQGAPISAAP